MRTNRGFSLVELATVVAITATVLGFAIPSLQHWRERAAATATLHALTVTLALARVEAVRRNASVQVCPSTDGRTCTSSRDWTHGWAAFEAPPHGASAPGTLIEAHTANATGLNVINRAGRGVLRFHPSGWAYGSNTTLAVCTPDGTWRGSVIVNNAGRVRVDRPKPDESTPCPVR